ncbi:hypothetical protein CONLIGDRAFT_334284 [Coniochaeta ligniaria NRRL 30616]|uniref:Uncharacterized protein n=1 Tax=Coniochaeta ligniaria NRRL 30616 TaxID=1408157 RepID=A0A1J7IQ34_9PEZI|nr:hypothetical protein CONLIGDRAFT_334284 [Coniochaeta ligniaria NRRL 30616]
MLDVELRSRNFSMAGRRCWRLGRAIQRKAQMTDKSAETQTSILMEAVIRTLYPSIFVLAFLVRNGVYFDQ